MRPRFNSCKVVPDAFSASTGPEREPIESVTIISLFAPVSYGTMSMAGGAEIAGSRPASGEAGLTKPHKVIQAQTHSQLFPVVVDFY